MNDAELFNDIYDSYNMFLSNGHYASNDTIFCRSEYLEIMLDNDALFNSIFEIRPYEYVLGGSRVKREKQVDSITYYLINPIINNCLRYALEHLDKYKHRAIDILKFGIRHNTEIINKAALIVVSVLGIGMSQKAKELQYYSNMETVFFTMLDGATKAENAGNLIKSVWYNAIYEERDNETDQYTMKNGKFVDDFNDALSGLFADENFSNRISEIEINQYEVADLMKQLQNPPKKYEEAYSVLKAYYDNYLKMTKIVISPTGSLNTFSEEFNTYDNNTADSYEKMKLYLD